MAPQNQNQSRSPTIPHVHLITIDVEQTGQRIDNCLLRLCKGVPKSHLYRLLRTGQVRVNSRRIDATYRLQCGDILRLPPMRLSQKTQNHALPHRPDFPVLFEDEGLLVIDKPAGIAVHGGSGLSFGVIEQLRASRREAKFLELVHRLDRETSGILLIAKKRAVLRAVQEQMRANSLDKRYWALVLGHWKDKAARHLTWALEKYTLANGRRQVRISAHGKAAHTIVRCVQQYADYSLLQVQLKTGRTHQIRAHLAHAGFPIVGDDQYGNFSVNHQLRKMPSHPESFTRMFLHAHQLTLTYQSRSLTLAAPLPLACQAFLKTLQPAKTP